MRRSNSCDPDPEADAELVFVLDTNVKIDVEFERKQKPSETVALAILELVKQGDALLFETEGTQDETWRVEKELKGQMRECVQHPEFVDELLAHATIYVLADNETPWKRMNRYLSNVDIDYLRLITEAHATVLVTRDKDLLHMDRRISSPGRVLSPTQCLNFLRTLAVLDSLKTPTP